jgi:hypothetical protein
MGNIALIGMSQADWEASANAGLLDAWEKSFASVGRVNRKVAKKQSGNDPSSALRAIYIAWARMGTPQCRCWYGRCVPLWTPACLWSGAML